MMPLPTKPMTVNPALRRSLSGDSTKIDPPIWQSDEARKVSERAARQGWPACSEVGFMRRNGWGVLDEPNRSVRSRLSDRVG